MKWVLALLVAVVLAVIGVTIWVGAQLSEPALEGGHHDRGLRDVPRPETPARPGWQARFEPADLRPGGESLGFRLVDRSGAPVEGARVAVAVARPAGPGDERHADAVEVGGGRYRAPVAFAAPGFWDVRLDARRGGQAVGVTQQVRIEAAGGPCALAAAPCTVEAGDLSLTLDLGRTLVTMKELPIAVTVRRGGAPLGGATVEVAFAMKEMNMGENRVVLRAGDGGRYAGTGVLVRCSSGRRDWVASVTVRPADQAPASASFEFTVRE
jgi:nitrogen fixation protein FixH